MQLWLGTQSFMLLGAQQFSPEHDFQTESYLTMVPYNKSEQDPLCHTWKVCICFGVCILMLVPMC